jgi:hypothetical protein
VTPVYNRGSLQGNFEDTLRELIPEAMAERAALVDRQELADSEKLFQRFAAADERVLDQLFHGRHEVGDLTGHFDRFVHLPLVRTTNSVMYPVLTFAYDWPRQVLRLRVALFYSPPVEEPRPRLRAFGLRFETPESWGGDAGTGPVDPDDPGGHHDMFHAQPVRRLHQGLPRTELPGLRWLNTTQPSIPISATDLSGLVLAMLVSIYGRKRIVKRYQAQQLQALKKAAAQVSGLPTPPERLES